MTANCHIFKVDSEKELRAVILVILLVFLNI